MTLAHAISDRHHPNSPEFQGEAVPHNIEAEQALLGILLYDHTAFHLIDPLEPEHFLEPTHGVMWSCIAAKVNAGLSADPIVIYEELSHSSAVDGLGGMRYLADLVDRAPPSMSAPVYAAAIRETYTRRCLISLGQEMSRAAKDAIPSTKIINVAEAGLLQMQVSSKPLALISAGQAAAKVLADYDAPPEARQGVMTGMPPLDHALGPMLPGDLVILAGRPSMGKSAFAECVALNIAEAGAGVIQINGEMTPEQMARRHMTDLCHREFGVRGPKYSDIRRHAITVDQRGMLTWSKEQLDPLPLLMLRRSGLRLSQLRSIARRQAMAWARQGIPFGALIVDHMGLIQPDENTRDRYADQTKVSNGSKALAEELEAPLFALNQLNRENERREDKRPQLQDLRDSGAWEQDADVVIGFYREAYYAQREPEPDDSKGADARVKWAEWDQRRRSMTIEAIILKAREGGTSTVKLWGDVARNAIRGAAPDHGDLL